MVKNIPNAKDLTEISKKLYFDALNGIISIDEMFNEAFPPDGSSVWSTEYSEYVRKYQPEIQKNIVLIQQANEISLKSKICEISPYLLLEDPSRQLQRKNLDFSTLKTISSSYLPKFVNEITDYNISSNYVDYYNKLNSYRNMIYHIGSTSEKFNCDELINKIIFNYFELWRTDEFCKDLFLYQQNTLDDFLYSSYKGFSTCSKVMDILSYLEEIIEDDYFKRIYGYNRETERYLCIHCAEDAASNVLSLSDINFRSAFLDLNDNKLHCAICGRVYEIKKNYVCSECDENVFVSAGEYKDYCCNCGKNKE